MGQERVAELVWAIVRESWYGPERGLVWARRELVWASRELVWARKKMVWA